ncbi:hypothetical protein [Mesorhizobium sp. M00.F.Ca.ET.217.01.1.1]|uniref:hypothetical protein n=1 Tax=Mesorhizobium sp. M00.F.Ca.ET.217.01.1.1 TaxID=2500529 RepID=UPI000FDCBA93|nr:hypothetical protein [Mesorhizobium sp. M00.F.Ca.ET.217.01.1.1]TGQ19339.1 hypothetical protein EN860_019620 [Mesorhizobium sp. M00.F.Ca.ET.217.01.1.1]
MTALDTFHGFPSDWFWIVARDETRFWSSAAAAYVTELPEGAGVSRIASEEELWDVLVAKFPQGLPEARRPPRLVPKRVIVDRLQSAGLLEAARAAIDAADLYTQERWNTRTDIFANDPTALALLEMIGGDPAIIFAE